MLLCCVLVAGGWGDWSSRGPSAVLLCCVLVAGGWGDWSSRGLSAVPLCYVLVAGGWGDWSSWQSCSVSCGDGVQLRHRTCDSPYPRHGGRECLGTDTDTRACQLTACEGQLYSLLSLSPNTPLTILLSVTCNSGLLMGEIASKGVPDAV